MILEHWMGRGHQAHNGAALLSQYQAQPLGKANDMLKADAQTDRRTSAIWVAPADNSDKRPVSEVAMMPGGVRRSARAPSASWKLARNA